MRRALAFVLWLGAAMAHAQPLATTCLPDGDDGDGLQLAVDEHGAVHLARVDRVPGALLHTVIAPDGTADDTVVVDRMSRLFDDEVRDLGLLVDGWAISICAHDAVTRTFGVHQTEGGAWSRARLDAGLNVGETCDLARAPGGVVVAWHSGAGLSVALRGPDGRWDTAAVDPGAGVQPAIAVRDDVIAVTHLDPDAGALRISSASMVGAIDRWRWTTVALDRGGWSSAPGIADGALVVYHGAVPSEPDLGSDRGLWSSRGPIVGPYLTAAEPGIDLGGSLDAVIADGRAWLFVRQRTRSAIFGHYDALFLDAGPVGGDVVRTTIAESGPAGRRHTWRQLQIDLDPFGSPVLAWFDEAGGLFGDPPSARVCFARAPDTDADAVPDHIELDLGTDPERADSDGDGRTDGEELLIDGSDPRVPGGECASEQCNGRDDDCDGAVDEDLDGAGCETGAPGRCAEGQIACIDGESRCSPLRDAAAEVCDGVDDDCDGRVDEGRVECGRGACAVDVHRCQGARPIDCVPAEPVGPDDGCDGVDDDCDGRIDEAWVPGRVSCGVGACAVDAPTVCIDGEVHDGCVPGPPAPSDPTCDGADDDCDGVVDEDVVPVPTDCGVGACARQGIAECVDGAPVDGCLPGVPEADDALCDGRDTDCDGAVDEGVEAEPTVCGVGVCAAIGALRCESGRVVDTCSPAPPRGLDDACDGLDDDCDGRIDEAFVRTARCGRGACVREGPVDCVDGRPEDRCEPGAPAPDVECDGVDADCDGLIDEAVPEVPTACGVGACRAVGGLRCVGGEMLDTCAPGVPAARDGTCDGVDDDCDGRIDEDGLPEPSICGTGACRAAGTRRCVDGGPVDDCVPGPARPDDATCDGIDDDCDGRVDEAAPDCACGEDDPDCDGADDDCDGAIDEDGACDCGPTDDRCDGQDDDCDGGLDEGFLVLAIGCGVGTCAADGLLACADGVEVALCTPLAPIEGPDICDGLDTDCDGRVDEDAIEGPIECGVGACRSEGTRRCVEGRVIERCRPGAGRVNDPTCNGVDDDCDGTQDEGVPAQEITCGVGACAVAGTRVCRRGRYIDRCVPDAPAVDDVDCDGIDDDCDGAIDEGAGVEETTCGTGACASFGTRTCLAGVVVDDCTPRAPAATDDACDGVDDDCDGRIDEGFEGRGEPCGVGACAEIGITRCVDGIEVSTCQPGAPSPDVSCDGVDDDCDGELDEGHLPRATTCGVGACMATGRSQCVNGQPIDDCTPDDPGPFDAECDGVDADCDGRLDEDFVGARADCGRGECRAFARQRCVDGRLIEADCRPGPAAGDDALCDGRDQDCDGRVDEDFSAEPEECGVGQCRASAVDQCLDGILIDVTCRPTSPALLDSVCDGADADCDGIIDEDCVDVDGGAIDRDGGLLPDAAPVADGGAYDAGIAPDGSPLTDGEAWALDAQAVDMLDGPLDGSIVDARAPVELDAVTRDRGWPFDGSDDGGAVGDPADAVRLDYQPPPLDSLVPPREYDCLGRLSDGPAPRWPLLVLILMIGARRR